MTLEDGCWVGSSALVIGGGPSHQSLAGVMIPSGIKVILTNWRYRVLKGDIVVAIDLPVVEEAMTDPRYPKGVPMVFADPSEYAYSHPRNDCLHLKCYKRYKWSKSLQQGLVRSTNTGLAAINLADVLGVSTIYLLGFEMESVGEFESGGYSPYEQFLGQFRDVARSIRAKVFNMTPGGRLDLFDRIDWKGFYRLERSASFKRL